MTSIGDQKVTWKKLVLDITCDMVILRMELVFFLQSLQTLELEELKQILPPKLTNVPRRIVVGILLLNTFNRILKGGCSRGGGNWGMLRIPREDWGTLGNIRED